ncbi:hypothetical protein AAFC00_005751 [Neodothiora populina]|uniref:Palmitoyltransferase n=1 Tax=Neodothiora populina TaxID=2781224 RepID=A0ABR3P6E5_9PEZI
MTQEQPPATSRSGGRGEDLFTFLGATISNDDASRPTGASISDNGEPSPTVPSMTGPVGEAALPPARRVSGNVITSSSGMRRTVSRGRGSYEPSPPTTATSRTHVPNIISSAFLRPISSKRAREQSESDRRPLSPPAQQLDMARPSSQSGQRSHKHRNSNASIVTVEGQPRPLVDPDAPPVPRSRGTGASITETQGDANRMDTAESVASHTPLHTPGLPAPLQLGLPTRSASSLKAQKSPRSPRSLQPSWGRQSRNRLHEFRDGHTKLESAPPSPAGYAAEEKAPKAIRPDLGRNHEYYNGNAVFFLHGRLINARQRPLNLLTAFMAILPAVLFFVFSAPWLWHNVSPAIPIIFAYIFYICLSSYLHASFTEPGIIPRNLHPALSAVSNDDPLAIAPPTTEWVTVRSFAQCTDGNTTAMEVPIKFCKSCNIWRPPRAHHCRVCDACIETQDHHCVWLNNCVGRRNYRYFFTFVASGTILGFYLLAASLAHILVWMVRHHSNFGHAVNVWRVPFAMFVYSLIIIPYPASLLIYHLFLTGRGETTREYLNSHKFQEKDRHRPFSLHSVRKNWAAILARPRPPTYMRFKGHYERGDRRIGDTVKTKKPEKQPEKESGLEMKQMNGSSRGSSRGFQGPRGRGPMNNINSTPRGDSPKL